MENTERCQTDGQSARVQRQRLGEADHRRRALPVCGMGPAVITALLHREMPGGTFAGLESRAFLHLIDLTKAHHAGGHETVPGIGRESAIALVLAAAAALTSLLWAAFPAK